MMLVRNLELRLGGFELRLEGLEVEAGRILVLLGPSGSGKSLLLRALAGLEPAASLDLRFDGRQIGGLAPERRRLVLVFQQPSLFPHMSVYANLEYGLRACKVGRAERRERVRRLAERLGLEELLGRRAGSLSGGEAQKVALARAVAARPRALLLDEPLSAVDALDRPRLAEWLSGLVRQERLPCVYVTHDRAEARMLADGMALICGGRLLQWGRPGEIAAAPACPLVARLLDLQARVAQPCGCTEVCAVRPGRCDAAHGGGSLR